ncbi:peptide chain release factor N(5)-glutamine methyltransferase [Arenimonas sp.]|uniref:peptide chain release factor N(5)-glutamine methyltransferase n=1 Tax=Arenimonas sp. TaxID=1872635 RepID=UPI0039E4C393
MSTVASALRDAAESLPGESARAEAEMLMGQALGRDRAWLFAHGDDELMPEQRDRFLATLQRRRDGEPIAHILGRRGFWSLDLIVSPDTLVPRPETELLVELALTRLPQDSAVRALDLGTGTGAIALAIACERRQAEVTAVDASVAALEVAGRNAARNALTGVRLLRSDWFSALAGERFDLIASNPPYIAESDPHLQEGDLRFEPHGALASGVDGLDAIRIIVAAAPVHLARDGWLLIEHGRDQGEAVRALFGAAGFDAIETVRDLEQRERVTLGRRT